MMPSEGTKGTAANECGAACAEQVRHSPILEGWLRIATRGLCEAAVKRIQSEVSSHYWEIVHSLHDEDLPEEEAQGRAIERLGDPDAARKGFQKTYLAGWQAYVLNELARVSDSEIAKALDLYAIGSLYLVLQGLLIQARGAGLFRAIGVFALFAIVARGGVLLMAKLSGMNPDELKRQDVSLIGAFHAHAPKATAVLILTACIPYGLGFAHFGTDVEQTVALLIPLGWLWTIALAGAWKLLFGERWRRGWGRDILAMALGAGLLWAAHWMLQCAFHILDRPLLGTGRVLAMQPYFEVACMTLVTLSAATFCASLATFLGAWLARKRGNEPGRAASAASPDDAT